MSAFAAPGVTVCQRVPRGGLGGRRDRRPADPVSRRCRSRHGHRRMSRWCALRWAALADRPAGVRRGLRRRTLTVAQAAPRGPRVEKLRRVGPRLARCLSQPWMCCSGGSEGRAEVGPAVGSALLWYGGQPAPWGSCSGAGPSASHPVPVWTAPGLVVTPRARLDGAGPRGHTSCPSGWSRASWSHLVPSGRRRASCASAWRWAVGTTPRAYLDGAGPDARLDGVGSGAHLDGAVPCARLDGTRAHLDGTASTPLSVAVRACSLSAVSFAAIPVSIKRNRSDVHWILPSAA
ncbi:hypothetical protein B0I32_126175 [Nonomuraea fuscirosea]|uniref:Uncharacterized protein n=1 Tax=Nonomuraea fuscirosea TaxID=1291556 RepID=A0A2T0MDY5_9ACTN|nr:hypothetical protein B0I32_126175 [Nonomuraea fuscirosea]